MNKAERANNYLMDEFFMELVEAQKDLYKSYIFGSAEHDVEGRERALVKLRAIEEFEASLQSLVQQSEIDKRRIKFF
jgi:hypothetical protein